MVCLPRLSTIRPLSCAISKVSTAAKTLHTQTDFTLWCRHGGGAAAIIDCGAGNCAPTCSFEASGLLAILARAVSCGQIGMVKSLMGLLPYETSHEITAFRDASGMGLLHLAVRSGSMGVLETLLEECGADCWQVSD